MKRGGDEEEEMRKDTELLKNLIKVY